VTGMADAKEQRQEEVLRIVTEQEIENQSQILHVLRQRGVQATQATISRDVRELKLVKVKNAYGICRYMPSDQPQTLDFTGRLRKIFRESVTSFDLAQNIVVLKTVPGLASAAAAAIDGMRVSDLVGSLAGDDTALLIMRDNNAAIRFCSDIHKMLK